MARASDDAYHLGNTAERARARNPRTHALRDRIHERLDGKLGDTSRVVWSPQKRRMLEGYLFLLDPDLEATPAVVQDVEQMLESL